MSLMDDSPCLHAGDEDDVFGSVLQRCEFGDLVELLIADFSVW